VINDPLPIQEADLPPLGADFSERFEREKRPPCQLYLISPPAFDVSFADALKSALSVGGVAAFQLRLKGLDDDAIARAAEPLQRICADHETAFIINDSITLAKRLGADGVHLGQGDGDPRDARALLGRDAQIGVTCHNDRHLAMEAGEAGADYVAFGAFYPTQTKKVQYIADPAILSWWITLFGTPCVAIGGITHDNAKPLIEAGVDFIAVSASVWNDPQGAQAAVAKFAALMS
jgi:thiamine-phosphate pyrophosphorylase